MALNDIDVAIHSALDADEIMQSALDHFVKALHADAGDIKLRDGDGWVVGFEHGFGAEVVGVRLAAAEAPLATLVAEKRRTVAVEDFMAEPGAYTGFPRSHNLRAGLAIPMIVRDEVIGCLLVWMRDNPRAFSAGEVDFARRLATSLALALENSRLLESEREERRRTQEAERKLEIELAHTKILLKASDELTSTIDPDELLERLGRIVTEATGISRVFINLIDMSSQTLTAKIATSGLVVPSARVIPFEQLSYTSRTAIEQGRTALLDYDDPALPDLDRQIARANHARLVLFIPLLYQGRVIGHISQDQPDERYEFSPKQIRIVESIAAQASVALQNARMYEREHRIAEALQQAILSPPEDVAALDVGCLYQPASAAADIGGDFYDVIDLGDNRAAILIGDVAGKGIEAAKLTSLLRDGARAYLSEDTNPALVMARLNKLAHRFMPIDKFATLFLGVLDSNSGVLEHSGAGHPAPIVVRSGVPSHLESAPGLLGAFPDLEFPHLKTELHAEDVLVLFTDGVTEARAGGRMFGEHGVASALCDIDCSQVAHLPHALLSEVLSFSGGRLRDDVVILSVARRGGNATCGA